ncbi:MAG: translation initiation factor IF-3 [Patescibacteria group bacterium]
MSKKHYRVNEQIRAPQVRVISEIGDLLGVMSASAALIEARSRGFDLVEVSPIANPPVCKIVNYGQLRYENRKKEQRQKSKQKSTEVKGIRLSTTISEHDTAVRVEQAKKFFSKGNKVQVELLLRGRQKAHPEIGAEVVNKFIKSLDTVAIVESPIKRQGGKFISLLTPKK